MPDAQRPPQASATQPATGTATVMVGCRMPHGIMLRHYVETEHLEDVMGGGKRPIKVFRPTDETFRINGTALPLLRDPDREYPLIIDGVAYTMGVPADLWWAWYETMRNEPMCRSGMIFAAEAQADVQAWGRQVRDQPTGVEPINPGGDYRMPRAVVRATGV